MSYKLINLFKILLIFSTLIVLINSTYSEKRLCGNPKCSVIISTGKTKLRYAAPENYLLSFNANTPVRIFGKSLVSNLWEVEITGRRGYVASTFILEDRIHIKKDQLVEVPVELLENKHNIATDSNKLPPKTDQLVEVPVEVPENKQNLTSDSNELPPTKELLVEVAVEVSENKQNLTSDSNKLPIKEDDKVVLKSSQVNSPDVDEVSSTTTSPLMADEMKNQINTDKIDTNASNELPISSPVQKNVVDGTPIAVEYNILNETDSAESDDNVEIDDENDEDEEYDENSEEIQNENQESNKLNDKNKKIVDSKTIMPSKSTEFLTLTTKLTDTSTPDKVKEHVDTNAHANINSDNKNQNQIKEKTEEQVISLSNAKQDSVEIEIKAGLTESESKTDTSAENINNNSEENLDLKENKVEINETIPDPIKYYTVGDEKVQKVQNENIETVKNNVNIDENKKLETGSDELKKIVVIPEVEIPKTEKIIEQIEDLKNEVPVALALESNNNQNIVVTNKLAENKNELINNNIEVTNETNNEHLLKSENIQLESKPEKNNEMQFESNKDNSSENNEEIAEKNNTQIYNSPVTSNILAPHESSQNNKIVEEKVIEKLPDLQENSKPDYVKEDIHGQHNHHHHDHHHHHHHGLSPLFKNQQIHNRDIKPKENVENRPEITTPNYDDSDYSDPYFETTTMNPIQQPLTENKPEIQNENIPEYKNEVNTPETLPILSELQNSDKLDEKSLNSENHAPEIINENEAIDQLPQNLPNENEGLFTTILNTVNNFLATSSFSQSNKKQDNTDNDIENIVYPSKEIDNKIDQSDKNQLVEDGFCENIGPNSCPSHDKLKSGVKNKNSFHCSSELDFFSSMSDKILDMFDVLVCLAIAAASSILFAFGYYCICNCRKESSLISKLNVVERSLLASYKEVAIVKHDLFETRNKLSSIQDNSFGSNDMVIALKRDIEEHEETNMKLREQITTLEKELENAAEAGLELNKIVSDLLSSQNGDASIANSVEDLQKQLNEQQKTIEEINSILGEKSRENSELNIFLSEQATNFQKELQELIEKLEESENSKVLLQLKFDEVQNKIHETLSKDLQIKENTIQSIKHELDSLQPKYNDIVKKWQTNEARVEALEECINSTKKDSKVNMKEFMDVANLKADILAIKRERDSLKERLEGEMDARKLLDDHVKIISEEVSSLKLEYNKSEKDKLEAQTRLDVLTNYFKEKETQLQKELSVKEAMSMKQLGETTSTVERVRSMQDEIQALKSLNDSLRAEIEAQLAAHKAQISTLENRAHEAWLTSRQSERKFDEARSEAAALRRKLTAIAGGPNEINRSVTDGLTSNNLNNAPSPIHMDSPSSPPLLGGLPPPPPFLPPPFMPPPFMGMPPPFMPPREMRPPPLGRLMSPPPIQSSSNHNRYSPSILDDEDDDDYEYEHRHSRSGGGGGRYTPENNRRYSPDSRYNYNTDLVSTYDTETDFSPPPSPRGFRSGGGSNRYDERSVESRGDRSSRLGNNGNGGYKALSPQPQQISTKSQISNSDIRNKTKSNKGILSSGSEKSFDSRKSKGKMKV